MAIALRCDRRRRSRNQRRDVVSRSTRDPSRRSRRSARAPNRRSRRRDGSRPTRGDARSR